jgi:hypothetical protein
MPLTYWDWIIQIPSMQKQATPDGVACFWRSERDLNSLAHNLSMLIVQYSVPFRIILETI